MYPVNNYFIVEEIKTESSSPASKEKSPVLYQPPTDDKVRSYRVLRCPAEYDTYKFEGAIITAQVKDVLEYTEGNYCLKYENFITVEENKHENAE